MKNALCLVATVLCVVSIPIGCFWAAWLHSYADSLNEGNWWVAPIVGGIAVAILSGLIAYGIDSASEADEDKEVRNPTISVE